MKVKVGTREEETRKTKIQGEREKDVTLNKTKEAATVETLITKVKEMTMKIKKMIEEVVKNTEEVVEVVEMEEEAVTKAEIPIVLIVGKEVLYLRTLNKRL